MLGKIRNVSKTVERVLASTPETRDSDTKLIIKVWELQGLCLTPEQQEKLHNVANPESIRRNRQKLQERGLYLGSLKIMRERKLRSYEMEQAMPAYRSEYEYDPITNTTQEVL
jgi:hypothetical protein